MPRKKKDTSAPSTPTPRVTRLRARATPIVAAAAPPRARGTPIVAASALPLPLVAPFASATKDVFETIIVPPGTINPNNNNPPLFTDTTSEDDDEEEEDDDEAERGDKEVCDETEQSHRKTRGDSDDASEEDDNSSEDSDLDTKPKAHGNDDDSKDNDNSGGGESDPDTSTKPKARGDSAKSCLVFSDDDDYFNALPDDSSDSEEESKGGGKGRKQVVGLPPIPKGASKAQLKDRKKLYDKLHAQKLREGHTRAIELTGNHAPTIRTMKEVKMCRLSKGQTFASRNYVLMRVREEANLRGISMRIEKSDGSKIVCWSRETVDFYVFARQSYKKGYEVVTAIVRPMDGDATYDGTILGVGLHPILVEEEEQKRARKKENKKKTSLKKIGKKKSAPNTAPPINDKGGDEDVDVKVEVINVDTNTVEKIKKRKFQTPYKAKDLVPLLMKSFVDDPNTSNKVMMNVLEPYGNEGVFTLSILQGARKLVRQQLYGTDEENVQYTSALEIAAPIKPGAKKKSNAGRKNEGKRKKGPLEKKTKKARKKKIGTPMEDAKYPFGVAMNPTDNGMEEGSV